MKTPALLAVAVLLLAGTGAHATTNDGAGAVNVTTPNPGIAPEDRPCATELKARFGCDWIPRGPPTCICTTPGVLEFLTTAETCVASAKGKVNGHLGHMKQVCKDYGFAPPGGSTPTPNPAPTPVDACANNPLPKSEMAQEDVSACTADAACATAIKADYGCGWPFWYDLGKKMLLDKDAERGALMECICTSGAFTRGVHIRVDGSADTGPAWAVTPKVCQLTFTEDNTDYAHLYGLEAVGYQCKRLGYDMPTVTTKDPPIQGGVQVWKVLVVTVAAVAAVAAVAVVLVRRRRAQRGGGGEPALANPAAEAGAPVGAGKAQLVMVATVV